jgi:3-oxoadipate CoA-transferase beta subunit
MDLVAGVETIFVITQHTTRDGGPKLVESCSYPLTGPGVVDRIYTNLAVIDVTPNGFQVVELAPGVDFEYVKARTGAPLLPIVSTAGEEE